jgi:cobalt-zinc-cadmium efflux system protein
MFIVYGILKESIERLAQPLIPDSKSIILVAAIGVIINFASAFFFLKDKDKDINVKGAFLHLLVDALVSVGVVVSGFVLMYTGWIYIDSIVGIVIALIIVFSTWGLLKESIRLTVDAVPKSISLEDIVTEIKKINGVEDIHHVHIWALSSTINAFTAHIVLNKENEWKEAMSIKEEIKHYLVHENIQHVTLEIETSICDCPEENC